MRCYESHVRSFVFCDLLTSHALRFRSAFLPRSFPALFWARHGQPHVQHRLFSFLSMPNWDIHCCQSRNQICTQPAPPLCCVLRIAVFWNFPPDCISEREPQRCVYLQQEVIHSGHCSHLCCGGFFWRPAPSLTSSARLTCNLNQHQEVGKQ